MRVIAGLFSHTQRRVDVCVRVKAIFAGWSLSYGSPDSVGRRSVLCDSMERCGVGLALSLFVVKEVLAVFGMYVCGLFFVLDFFVAAAGGEEEETCCSPQRPGALIQCMQEQIAVLPLCIHSRSGGLCCAARLLDGVVRHRLLESKGCCWRIVGHGEDS
jgi:hypothetical protein